MKQTTLPKSKIKNWDLANKTVFLRVDLNVPLKDGVILNDFRLKAILPTIDLLLSKQAQIILGTHIGRPRGYDAALSTQPLAEWFKARGYTCSDPVEPTQHVAHAGITLLENLRFYPGEKKDDLQFAHMLAHGADYYVNDAWALMHRHDTSVTLVPSLFAETKRSIGLLVEQELHALTKIKDTPQHPFVAIIGGGKVADKLPALGALVSSSLDTIILGPAIVFTFLKALGKPVGLSLVDNNLLDYAKKIIELAETKKVAGIFPVDYVIAQNSFYGPLSYCTAQEFPNNGVGISVGPRTLNEIENTINTAQTIFVNGLMGDISRPETLSETKKLLQLIAGSPAYTVIGGGDSVAAVHMFGLEDAVDFCSTGGGATLAYISHAPMPGLEYY